MVTIPNSERQPDDIGAIPAETTLPKSQRSFAGLKLELSDKEFGSSGVTKMMVAEIERLREDNHEIRALRRELQDTTIALKVAESKLGASKAGEIVLTGCFTLGGLFIGYIPNIQQLPWLQGGLAVAGGVLFIMGMRARAQLK